MEELKSFNGENGRPIYIAYKGRVIDVTASKMWRGGTHMKRHAAGQDLTAEMQDAPHDIEVLDRYPQVGVLEAVGARHRAGPGHARLSPSPWTVSSPAIRSSSAIPTR